MTNWVIEELDEANRVELALKEQQDRSRQKAERIRSHGRGRWQALCDSLSAAIKQINAYEWNSVCRNIKQPGDDDNGPNKFSAEREMEPRIGVRLAFDDNAATISWQFYLRKDGVIQHTEPTERLFRIEVEPDGQLGLFAQGSPASISIEAASRQILRPLIRGDAREIAKVELGWASSA